MSRATTTTLDPLHAIESCAHTFLNWKPFSTSNTTTTAIANNKRHCRADRATSAFSIDLDLSKLSLFDDGPATRSNTPTASINSKNSLLARKRRRRRGGSRSVSGRSSDRRCVTNGGTCSDFLMVGTDSSGEMFGEVNWASDVSVSEKESVVNVAGACVGQLGNFIEGNESGYGSEPGYRGDAEIGYDDEEEDDTRALFWGDEFVGSNSKLERVGENSLQKGHHRCRRKKHDIRMVDTIR